MCLHRCNVLSYPYLEYAWYLQHQQCIYRQCMYANYSATYYETAKMISDARAAWHYHTTYPTAYSYHTAAARSQYS